MLKLIKKMTLIVFFASVCIGFRTYTDTHLWSISNSSAAKTKLFVSWVLGSSNLKNDLPSGDALTATNPITVNAAMSSIFSDYNNITGAYVTLVDTADPDYAAESNRRKIFITESATDGMNAGQASFQLGADGKIDSCEIVLSSSVFDSAKSFISTVTHELGHCLGLDHSHDTIYAIMSYFHGNDIVRLQMDDKMGLIFLYPTDPSKAKESATYGLSCARR